MDKVEHLPQFTIIFIWLVLLTLALGILIAKGMRYYRHVLRLIAEIFRALDRRKKHMA